MKDKKYSSGSILIMGYAVVLLFFVYFTATSLQDIDFISVIINVVMLSIALVIFLYAGRRFKDIKDMEKNLVFAIEKIEQDFEVEKVMLWEKYKKNSTAGILAEGILSREYKAYVKEMQRLEIIASDGFKCKIDDYINRNTVDQILNKNLLNLVPGVMTGLGILGTFIGLSLGLQNFNTGSSGEIAESIAPLMSGIKVAFHTSVFGMILSLFFNYAYKKIQVDAYKVLDEFLNTFTWYVCSDGENDYYNQMLVTLPERMGHKVAEIMAPHFEKMENTIGEFSNHMLENQLKGVGEIVNSFVDAMHKSLGDNLHQLGDVIDQTCELQRKNNESNQMLLEKIGIMTVDIHKINELTGKTIEELSSYISDVEKLQTIINDSYMSVQLQLDENRLQEEKLHKYMEELSGWEKAFAESANQYANDIVSQTELLNKLETEILDTSKNNLMVLNERAESLVSTITEMVKEEVAQVQKSSVENGELLVAQAEKHNQELAELVKKQIQEISALSSDSSNSMQQAAQNVVEMVKGELELAHKVSAENIEAISEQAEKRNQELAELVMDQMREIATVSNDTSNYITQTAQNITGMVKGELELLHKTSVENVDALADHAEKRNQELVDVAKKQMQEIVKFSNNTSNEMNQAAQNLSEVSKQLNSRLNDSLGKTFDIFDSELEKITKRLSGTISQVDSTTERVPQVVAAAYEGMEEVLDEMRSNMQSYVETVAQMQDELMNIIENYK